MNSRKRGYWRQVRKGAWELSRQHFEWTFPIATAVAVIVLDVLIRGWDKAMENLSSTFIAAGAAIVVALLIYGFNIGRSAFRRRVDPIDTLIKKPVAKYVGHDEGLEVRTRQRRDQAERIRRQARQMETDEKDRTVPFRKRA